MCIELMLLAVNFNFVAFTPRFLGILDGQIFVFFILTVAAAERRIGLAILVRACSPAPQHQWRRSRHDEGLNVEFSQVCLAIVLAPLIAAVVSGLAAADRRTASHVLCIAGVPRLSPDRYGLLQQMLTGAPVSTRRSTPGASATDCGLEVGFLIDNLSALMLTVVDLLSLAVHVTRSATCTTTRPTSVSLPTFRYSRSRLLMLVMSNTSCSFLRLGSVGLVSYC